MNIEGANWGLNNKPWSSTENLRFKHLSADTLQLLKQLPKEEFDKVIKMNRAQRRKWFRENKISRLVDKPTVEKQ